MSVLIRAGGAVDHDYIVATWCDSYWAAVLPWDSIGEVRRRLGREIAERLANSRVVIACDVDDRDRIYGWAVGDPGVLHYVYVRETRRKSGHGAALVRAACGEQLERCTTLTPMMQAAAARRGIVWRRKALKRAA